MSIAARAAFMDDRLDPAIDAWPVSAGATPAAKLKADG